MIIGSSHEQFTTTKEIKNYIRAKERTKPERKQTLIERPLISPDLMK